MVESLERRVLLTGTWGQLTHAAPGGVGTMLLLPDGTVMAQINGTSADWARLTPDSTGSYQNGAWTRLASMHDTRLYCSTQVLQDGRLFIAGGEYGTGSRTGEVYDPLTNTWTALPTQNFGNIIDAMSDTLPDGRVMVAPVSPSPSGVTIIFDPATNSWSQGPKIFRGGSTDEQSFVKLADGSILTVDGNTTSERFIPSLNQWVNDGAVPVTLFDSLHELGPGVLLADGRAFFIGATGHTALYTPSGTNSPGTWVAGPDLPAGLGDDDAPGAVLPDGTVLCVAGPSGTYNGPTTFYIYDPVANSFTNIAAPGGSVTGPPFGNRMLDLPNGTVLFTTGGSTPYVYNPNTSPLPAAQPTITNLIQNADGTFTLTGTLFNGISEGAAYGDDAQMSSNYPMVRLTGATGTTYYARVYGWSSTGVQTGATPQSANFVLPLGIPASTYSLSVVANGVASTPVTLTIPTVVSDLPPTVVTAAKATPSPVTGTTTSLTVLGDDDGGEANLTYTWTTTTSPSGAPTPSFSINGTNAAKTTTATFHRVGTYTFKVYITDQQGLSTTSSVTVTVSATATSVTVSPNPATITSGGTQNLTGTTLDQFGQTMTTATAFVWSIVSGAGSVTSTGTTSGRYNAPGAGTLATVKGTSGALSATTQIGVVTSPWASSDVGSVSATGIASDTGAGGTFTIAGSGSDIWNTADEFRYVYRTLSGNEAITAHIVTQQNTNASAKVGVMIRNSLSAGDQYAFMELTPTSGAELQYRATSGASAAQQSVNTGVAAPYWVRLVRNGNTFTGYRSTNGTTWISLGSVTVAMTNTTVDVGLAVCSHNDGTLSTATIDNVTVSQPSVATGVSSTPNPVNGKTTALSVLGADTAGESALTYTWSSTSVAGSTPVFSTSGTNAAKNSTATFSHAGTYTITCTISDGVLTTTSSVSVTVNPVVTSIIVSPSSSPSVRMGGTQQFTATASDQFNVPLDTQPSFTWSVDGAGNSIDTTGLFTAGTSAAGTFTVTATSGSVNGTAPVVVLQATVSSREVFYNDSFFDNGDPTATTADDAAIATDKTPLLPGQTATAANYTTYVRGINGLMIDIKNLPLGATLTAADFTFKMGVDPDPTTWTDAPAVPPDISVRLGAGGDASTDRITLIWPDNTIQNIWLQVTVNATADTGLSAPDVFYFGNLIGDGNGNGNVTVADVAMTKSFSGQAADITSPVDFNRSGQVSVADVAIAKAYQGNSIPMLVAPLPPPPAAPSVVAAAAVPSAVAVTAAIVRPVFSVIPIPSDWPSATPILTRTRRHDLFA
jgi:hypothetical protein